MVDDAISSGNDDDEMSMRDLLMSVLITNMRLYDVQMTLLTVQDKNAAASLYNLHKGGGIMGTMPKLVLEDE